MTFVQIYTMYLFTEYIVTLNKSLAVLQVLKCYKFSVVHWKYYFDDISVYNTLKLNINFKITFLK